MMMNIAESYNYDVIPYGDSISVPFININPRPIGFIILRQITFFPKNLVHLIYHFYILHIFHVKMA